MNTKILESNLAGVIEEILPGINKHRTLCDRLLGIKYECNDPGENSEHEVYISEEEPNLKTESIFFLTLLFLGDGYRGCQIYTRIKINDGKIEYNIPAKRRSLRPVKYLLTKFAEANNLELFYKEKM